MPEYDDEAIVAAADAWEDAWGTLGPDWDSCLSCEATALAMGIGIVYAARRGELQSEDMARSALDQVAIAVLERRTSVSFGKDDVPWLGDPECHLSHAEEMRAIAEHVRTPRCRELLLNCASDFQRIAASRAALNASIALLYPPKLQ